MYVCKQSTFCIGIYTIYSYVCIVYTACSVCVYKEPSCALRSSVWCKRSHQVMAVSLPLLLVIHELPKALTLSYASLKPRNMYSILQNISDPPAQLAEWCGVSLSGLPVAIRTGHTSRCLGKNAITELALAVLLKDALTVWCDLHPRGFESIFGLVVAFFFLSWLCPPALWSVNIWCSQHWRAEFCSLTAQDWVYTQCFV